MKKKLAVLFIFVVLLAMSIAMMACNQQLSSPMMFTGDVTYDIVVYSFEGGPAIKRVIITFEQPVIGASLSNNTFVVSRSSSAILGYSATDNIFLSDENGVPLKSTTASSRFVTIEYEVKPTANGNSFQNNLAVFDFVSGRNVWRDLSTYTLSVREGYSFVIGRNLYTSIAPDAATFGEKIIPSLKNWRITGVYEYDGINSATLHYAMFEPVALSTDSGRNPLIIWLHGGGEGGTDPTIALLGNQVTELGKDTVQQFFRTNGLAGAYVLVPQTPRRWMATSMPGVGGFQGTAPSAQNWRSWYTDALWSLIRYYAIHPDIDPNRIYIGGCSNGGYMVLNILFTDTTENGSFFAAAYPVCNAFNINWLTAYEREAAIARWLHTPTWFMHTANDRVTVPALTTDWYIALLNAGHTDIWYTFLPNVYGRDFQNQTYNGHWSWIFTLQNRSNYVQDRTGTGEGGSFTSADLNPQSTLRVQIDGRIVSLWEWISRQTR